MGDELRTGLGKGIEGNANAVGSKDANINHNVVHVDADSLNDVKDEIRDIKADQGWIKRDVDLLKDAQRDIKNAVDRLNTRVEGVSVRVETALNKAQEKPVTLFQVVMSIVAVICFMVVILLLGMWLGGMR